MVKFYNNIYSC